MKLEAAEKTVSFLKLPVLLVFFAIIIVYASLNLHGVDHFFHIKSGEHIVSSAQVSFSLTRIFLCIGEKRRNTTLPVF